MISVCRKSVEKQCETERVGHMVSKKDDEGRILVVEEEKKKAKKIHDRTYDIIMSEKPQRRFRFRYVVYTAGLLIGFKMLYKHNESFKHWCQKVAISYKCGRLQDDFKNFWFNFLFAENATVKVWWSSVSEKARGLLSSGVAKNLIGN